MMIIGTGILTVSICIIACGSVVIIHDTLQSRQKSGRKWAKQDTQLIWRNSINFAVAFLVWTTVLCYMTVVLITKYDNEARVMAVVMTLLVVCCINPVLYTMTTTEFKSQVRGCCGQ